MKFRPAYGALLAVLVLVLACSMPLSRLWRGRGMAAGITAQAGALQAGQSAAAPAIASTGGTAMPTGVQVSLSAPTDCRSGPGAAYPLVFNASPGVDYQVVGKYSGGIYWIIVNPAGGTCWLWGQYADVTGNVGSVASYLSPPLAGGTMAPDSTAIPTDTPLPTATSSPTQGPTHAPPPPPAAPTSLRGSRTCTAASDGTTAIWIELVTLTWHDTFGENGYRIYEGGAAITTIAQSSVSYQMQLRYKQGAGGAASDSFGVEAYNTGGTSARSSVDVPRCP